MLNAWTQNFLRNSWLTLFRIGAAVEQTPFGDKVMAVRPLPYTRKAVRLTFLVLHSCVYCAACGTLPTWRRTRCSSAFHGNDGCQVSVYKFQWEICHISSKSKVLKGGSRCNNFPLCKLLPPSQNWKPHRTIAAIHLQVLRKKRVERNRSQSFTLGKKRSAVRCFYWFFQGSSLETNCVSTLISCSAT